MNSLIIVGAGGFAREVAWLVERINTRTPTWKILGFLDDDPTIQQMKINNYPVLGTVDCASNYPEVNFICAIGSSRTREKVVSKIKSMMPDVRFATLIDPTVELSDYVSIGEGTIICAHSIITVNIKIGVHAIINLDCTVGHDAELGDYVTLYPSVNVSGITAIGRCTELGTGMQIIQGKCVGEYSIIGAGAVVVKDIPSYCTAVGSPAKPIKFFDV